MFPTIKVFPKFETNVCIIRNINFKMYVSSKSSRFVSHQSWFLLHRVDKQNNCKNEEHQYFEKAGYGKALQILTRVITKLFCFGNRSSAGFWCWDIHSMDNLSLRNTVRRKVQSADKVERFCRIFFRLGSLQDSLQALAAWLMLKEVLWLHVCRQTVARLGIAAIFQWLLRACKRFHKRCQICYSATNIHYPTPQPKPAKNV